MKSAALVLAAATAVASASDVTVSVMGVDRIFSVFGGSPCSGSDPSRLGMCPGPQEYLHFGSCCVQLPGRDAVVMGCMPLRSSVDTCDALAASLGHTATSTTSAPVVTTSDPLPSTPSSDATTVAPVVPLPDVAPGQTTTSAPSDATTSSPSDTATTGAPATTTPTDASTPESTTSEPLIINGTQVQSQQSMTDNSAAGTKSATAGATSTVSTLLLVVGCCAAALAVVGGVLFARKKNETAAAGASPSTPPQPLSLPVGYAEESPIDEDSLTPLSAVVCM
ncbi:hypothetical protein ACHHYP_01291 [Achlya hypogyna]|uniref:Secreted protein n=1 Tax=Achlya hypogyna TaxID=1202772 RepID=A0A1V9Z8X7_ACHHY|nr:hypothetical protein ACHHYP_01291 [Achlya hypogyna]